MILPFLPILTTAPAATSTSTKSTRRSTTSSFIVIKFLLIYVIKSVTTLLDENPILVAGNNNNNNNLTRVTIVKNGGLNSVQPEPLPVPQALAQADRMDDGLPIFPERPDAVYFIVAGKFFDKLITCILCQIIVNYVSTHMI